MVMQRGGIGALKISETRFQSQSQEHTKALRVAGLEIFELCVSFNPRSFALTCSELDSIKDQVAPKRKGWNHAEKSNMERGPTYASVCM